MSEPLAVAENLAAASFCDKISFEANPGEILCLFGMNGSGKTLFIKALCGVFKPFAGSAKILAPKQETGICLQFPEHLVFCDTALKEAVLITGDEDKGRKLLEDIGARPDQPPFFMSDGQKRLLFVFGLMEKSKLLIFDEPFASLDGQTKKEVAKRMKEAAANGKTFIYTANRRADTVIADKVIEICGKSSAIPLKI